MGRREGRSSQQQQQKKKKMPSPLHNRQTDRHAELYIVPELKVPFPNLSVYVAASLSGKLLSCLVLFWEAQTS